MKIAFVTTYNAQDIKNWSGTSFYMSRAFIDAGIEVDFIGNLKNCPNNFSFKIKNKLYNRILRKKLGVYNSSYEPKSLRYFAQQVHKRIEKSDPDIILSPGAFPIAYLNTDKPIVMWADATFAVMHNYYTDFSNFNRLTVKNCHRFEKEVLKRASLAIYSSDWAARSAIYDYNADPNKVKVVHFGANIQCNRGADDIVEINKSRQRNVCKLLFIGQDWERKGGETAVNIAKEMNKKIKTELTIVGCVPPYSGVLPDFVKVLGFIDKYRKENIEAINKLYIDSHFFVLPTIAECTPIVFSEANSYGLPVITINTGGIPSIIKNEVNGKMFSVNSNPLEWANYIRNIFSDVKKYDDFSLRAFNEYLSRLNWDISIKRVIGYIGEMTALKSNTNS